ncbi:ArsR/SmtB family transcription factor [Roseateles violae]|uniref:Metalloregulator ArsR/SmtB family transcription factor n=1 Tax=Roseateles violae TaxID=3058042 RepID=A0ABT8DM75_9BURK|nr:metalloregulator ArsR/SmtB family transcription factor [Pelomonas sp. PFR6]MDN3919023.1 metalloregulator ArsR/SmtB family transcription factor [Pelomonas sp. PFR6]
MSETSFPPAEPAEAERVYEIAAELFSLMSTPMRLKIISALCRCEKTVGELLQEIATTQPNMSQHLSQLYRAGILARRREGQQIFYRVQNERAVALCRAVCTQIAIEIDDPAAVEPAERLIPSRA